LLRHLDLTITCALATELFRLGLFSVEYTLSELISLFDIIFTSTLFVSLSVWSMYIEVVCRYVCMWVCGYVGMWVGEVEISIYIDDEGGW
jgi:hypothetical protein